MQWPNNNNGWGGGKTRSRSSLKHALLHKLTWENELRETKDESTKDESNVGLNLNLFINAR
jgi:hypothetical protein